MQSGGGGTAGHRCPPNAHRRHLEGDGVREASGDILPSCGVTRCHFAYTAIRQPENAISSVGETASDNRFQGGEAEGADLQANAVTTPPPDSPFGPSNGSRSDPGDTRWVLVPPGSGCWADQTHNGQSRAWTR
jgi:hypothetical protein